ncbi:MAG: aminotransferase class I/II-fold pyridoxal phosphate-dependent enzyme [Clostridia bacterium]
MNLQETDFFKNELKKELNLLEKYKERNLSLDMSRGKPSKAQLDISTSLLDELNSTSNFGKIDYRNYGINDGISEIKDVFCDLLGIKSEEIIVSGNASLNLMYDSLQRALQFGVLGGVPWNKQGLIKWLCPVPGYDRHFAVTELFGIQMINIPMKESGPDMDLVEELIKDESVKGIWCVPKYSNPQGIIYNDDTIKRFAKLKPKAMDFRVFWDNAYNVHGLYGYDPMLDVFHEAKKEGNEDLFYIFGSTSKITFAGAGVAYIYGSQKNMDAIRKFIGIQTIGPDKLVQLCHAKYLKNKDNIFKIMDRHADLLRPKFEKVIEILDNSFGDTGIAKYTRPRGGYFISVDLKAGTAKRTLQIALEAGVRFTNAGATFPYGRDPNDSNVRIAPSLPPINELIPAMEIFCCAAKIAYYEKKLGLL